MFDLTLLKEFNPALVYGFDAESSIRELDPRSLENGGHIVGQYIDMFNAYLYCQDVLLPSILKRKFSDITVSEVIAWLDELHSRIAKTLADDWFESQKNRICVAGKISSEQILRWRHDGEVQSIIGAYILGFINKQQLIKNLVEITKFSDQKVSSFIKLICKARDNNSIHIVINKELTVKNKPEAYETIQKFSIMYHSNCFSSEEKKIISQFVKICLPPEKMEGDRLKFVSHLLNEWSKCDANNLEAVIKFAHFVFHGITEGHWYFNANGRLATCFMNLVLRSFGKPSILMRNPGEREDEKSSYRKAIDNIDEDPQLLFIHLKNRISDAIKNGPFEDKLLGELATKRVILNEIFTGLKRDFPDYPIIQDYLALYKKTEDMVIEWQKDISKPLQIIGNDLTRVMPELLKRDFSRLAEKQTNLLMYAGLITFIDSGLALQKRVSQSSSTTNKTLLAFDKNNPLHEAGNAHNQLLKIIHTIVPPNTLKYESFITAIKAKAYSQALRRACTIVDQGGYQLVKILLSFKDKLLININEQAGKQNYSAIYYAAINGNIPLFELLKENGADADHIKDAAGFSPSYYLEKAKQAVPI